MPRGPSGISTWNVNSGWSGVDVPRTATKTAAKPHDRRLLRARQRLHLDGALRWERHPTNWEVGERASQDPARPRTPLTTQRQYRRVCHPHEPRPFTYGYRTGVYGWENLGGYLTSSPRGNVTHPVGSTLGAVTRLWDADGGRPHGAGLQVRGQIAPVIGPTASH